MIQAAPRSDKSDDEIMQALALAANHFKSRFGEKRLIACLEDLLRRSRATRKTEIPGTCRASVAPAVQGNRLREVATNLSLIHTPVLPLARSVNPGAGFLLPSNQ